MSSNKTLYVQQVITDYQLFAMLAVFISIDLLIIIISEIIDPLHAEQHFTGREVRKRSSTKAIFFRERVREFSGAFLWEKSESSFLIQDHSDHGVSKEPTNPLWVRIRRFL